MKLRWIGMLAVVAGGFAVLLTAGGLAPDAQPNAAQSPNDKQLFSYGVGFTIGERVRGGLEGDGVGADFDLVAKGFVDALNGKACALPRDKMEEVLRAVQDEMDRRTIKRRMAEDPAFKQVCDENLRKGKEYVEKHRHDEGMITAPNGVLYRVVHSGGGAQPKATDTVIVTYRGMLTDGTQYDASEKIELSLPAILRVPAEILQLMHVGDKWHVIIPPEQAYGPVGKPPMVGPNEALVIDVELLGIK